MSNKGPSLKETFLTPIIANNPVMIQVLGICSSLAVTSSMNTAFVMFNNTISTITMDIFIKLFTIIVYQKRMRKS